PMLRTESRQFLGGGSSAISVPGMVGEWTEALLVGNQQAHPGVGMYHRQLANHGVTGSTGLGSSGTVKVMLETPSGSTLSVRHLRLQAARPADSSGKLAIALVVLVGTLLAILIVGWLIHRRKPPGERL